MTRGAKAARPIVIILAVAAAAAGGYWWWSAKGRSDGPLVLQGNVEVRQVNLGFKVAGRIKELFVDDGDGVQRGQNSPRSPR